ncbi:hypothetical protein ACFYWS_20685 [Streptomyces sp. NPDC002795]|uniref:hypothetical protein n=1 Tax=Streptomyces sp. NPDC002795 TaxID=3364665 RepID=UPI00369B82C2
MIRTKNRACAGKIRHPTRPDAEEHKARLIEQGAVRLNVYRCRRRSCHGWHVGHLPRNRTTQ